MGHLIKIILFRCFNAKTSSRERASKTWLWLPITIVALSLSGCINGRVTQTPNPHQPTPTSTQEQIVFPELLNPTEQIFSPDQQEIIIAFEPIIVTHPKNLFSLEISNDWQVDPEQYGAVITDPHTDLKMTVRIVNTGYDLNHEAFKNFIDIQEESASTEFTGNIKIENHEIAKEKSILITKLVPLGGSEKILATNYQQHDDLILIIDFLAEPDLYNANRDIFTEIIKSATVNQENTRELELYSFDDANRFSNGYYSILIPPFWRHEEIQDEYSILNTFLSPDNQAVIQMLVFDDGNRMSNTIAAGFTLKLLRDNYAKDVLVLEDEILPDGREILQWRSENANYQGETAFATCDSALFMITVITDEDLGPVYQTLLKDVMYSYSVDIECE